MGIDIGTVYLDVVPDMTGFGSKVERGSATAADKASKNKAALKTWGKVGLLAGVAFVGAFVKGSLDEAKEAEKVGKQFASAFSREGLSGADSLSTYFDEVNNRLGVTDEQLQTTAAHILAFGDIESPELLRRITIDATNLVAATEKSPKAVEKFYGALASGAPKAITMAQNLGILTQEQADYVKTLPEAERQQYLLNAAHKAGGTAAADNATKSEKFALAVNELKEKVGTALLPVMNKLMDIGMKVLNWFSNLSPQAKKVAAIVGGGLVAALIAAKLAMIAVSLANPFTAIALAVVTVAALVIANWSKVQRFFTGLWDGLKAGFFAVANVIIGAVEGVINFVIAGINKVIAGLNLLPGVNIDSIGRVTFDRLLYISSEQKNTPQGENEGDRYRAAGGPVRAGRPYIVGERGPEKFVPDTNGTIVPNHQLGGGGPINIYVTEGLTVETDQAHRVRQGRSNR